MEKMERIKSHEEFKKKFDSEQKNLDDKVI